jgi:ApaG protein
MKTKALNIHITTHAHYLPDQSSAENNRYLWSYDVTIQNDTDEIIQLLNRYWRIVDMRGKVEEVRGPGVIGLQPIIKPGKNFAYSSYCQLMVPQGTMEGHFEMQNLNEQTFLVQIPQFPLISSSTGDNAAYRSRLH